MTARDTVTTPAVSVVVATRDRRELLRRTLDTLAGQTSPVGFEVIVADHGSTDGTASLVRSFADRLDVRSVPVPYRHESIADPKNAGARAARGDLLVFLDSGMMCPPGFIAAHVAEARDGDGVTAGAVLGWDSEDEHDPFWAVLDLTRLPEALPPHLTDPRAKRWADCADTAWMLAWGANLAVPRRAFLAVGGFDTDLRGWGWDDLELAYRLTGSGRPLRYAPAAWAVHYPHPRAALVDRMATAQANWHRAHSRHRAPELETWESCDYWDHSRLQRRLRATAARIELPPAPPPRAGVRRRVMWGFASAGRATGDVHITLPGKPSTASDCVSWGLRTTLSAAGADVAVASPALLDFDWSPGGGWPPVAVAILRELGRVGTGVEVRGRIDPSAGRRLHALANDAGLASFAVRDV